MTSPTLPPRRRLAAAGRVTGAVLLAGGLLLGGAATGTASAAAAPALSAPVLSSPVLASPVLASPVLASPVLASPVLAAAPLLQAAPVAPTEPTPPTEAEVGGPALTVDVNGVDGTPNSAVTLILAITLLSVAPALLLMMTAFTKIIVVLGIARNAIGLPTAPPNQVLAGLALFLSLFIMAPVITQINDTAVQPFLAGTITQGQAFDIGQQPLRTFMVAQTREEDLALITRAADRPNPENVDDLPLTTLIPAFVLSELRAAFIIGFVIFMPFLIIDIVVSAILMAMGMMMLPPVTVSLPFKLLLFVLVNGWGLIITALVGSYQ